MLRRQPSTVNITAEEEADNSGEQRDEGEGIHRDLPLQSHYVISPKWPVAGIDVQMKGDTPGHFGRTPENVLSHL